MDPQKEILKISNPMLFSKQVVLRSFTLNDTHAMFAWASDPEVTRFLRFRTHKNLRETANIIAQWIAQASHPPYFQWAIVPRGSDTPVGSIGVVVVSAGDARGEVGYCLAKDFWGKGYATEALRLVLTFCFETANFERIQGCHAVGNKASGRVMEKAGMILEAGPLRHYYYANLLGYQDAMLYRALADDYIV